MIDSPQSISESDFRKLADGVRDPGPEHALRELASQFRAQGRYHEYFEARLMECRFHAGLPTASPFQTDGLPQHIRDQLEKSYLQVCGETGRLFLEDGKLREAWMYLRTLEDHEPMRIALRSLEVNAETIDSVLEIAIYEGVDLALGFKHLLSEMGTCNAITTYESVMPTRSMAERQQIAALLVDHLHHELATNLTTASEEEASSGKFATNALEEILAELEGTFGEYTVHVDASHLSSVVRFAEIVDNQQSLERAYDLTLYGQRLHQNFHFPCPAPFEEMYTSHRLLFGAQLGKEVEAAVDYFAAQAEKAKREDGTAWPAEVYVMLLDRLGKSEDALQAGLALFPHERQLEGVAPSLLELASKSGKFEPLLSHYRDRGEWLPLVAALIQRQSSDLSAR